MPLYTVTLPKIKVVHDEVILRETTVQADYFRIDAGHLIFRNSGRNGDYPDTVRAFAPGHWTEVIQTIRTPAQVAPYVYDLSAQRREIDMDEALMREEVFRDNVR